MAQGVNKIPRTPFFSKNGKWRFWLASAALHAVLLGAFFIALELPRPTPSAPGPLSVSVFDPAPKASGAESQAAEKPPRHSVEQRRQVAKTSDAAPQSAPAPEADDLDAEDSLSESDAPSAQALPSLQAIGEERPARPAGGEGSGLQKPPYPHWARSRGWEGRIELELKVLPSGRVGIVKVLQSTGHGRLDDYTVRWCKENLVFVPATLGGVPITTTYRVAYRYELT